MNAFYLSQTLRHHNIHRTSWWRQWFENLESVLLFYVNANTNKPRKQQRYVLHDLFVTGRDFNSETPEAFIKVLGKQTNMSIHVIKQKPFKRKT